MQQLPLDLIQVPPPTLDNYVVGPNAQAVSTIEQIARGNPPAKIVVLCGPPGSGKTHLLNALLARDDTLLASTSALMDAQDQAYRIWLADDPATLSLREDLRTRLASGLLISLGLLSDDDKAVALQQHANARGLKADQKVLDWLLTFQDRDIRHLMAYLDAVDRYALQNRRPLSVALLREFERNQQRSPAD